MKMLEKSLAVNLEEWDRKEYFYYFTKLNPTAFSLTVDIDVTETYNYAKLNKLKFFPIYLFLGTKTVVEIENFRLGYVEEKLVRYEKLHPSYSIFHKDDQTISSMWTAFSDNFMEFHQNYLQDIIKYQAKKGPMVKELLPPANSLMIGTIPWVSFNSYTPISLSGAQTLLPVIQSSKLKKEHGKVIMPVSMTIHHAVGDGYHASLFFNNLQEKFDHPEKYLIEK